MDDYQKLIDEYTEPYCLFLEATYAQGMLSEGGSDSIDAMFAGQDLSHKKLLDIGSGLGGVDFYLAEKHQASIVGIELNSWLAEEATRRIPEHLQPHLSFITYDNPPLLPLDDDQFDIVFSKGVFAHVKEKGPLFQEVYRVLKPGGLFIVNDWLSPTTNLWSPRFQKMCEIENLTIYAHSIDDYKHFFKQAGFANICIRDESMHHAKFNFSIVENLQVPQTRKSFIEKFGEQAWKEAIEGYQLITDAIKEKELLVTWFQAEKPE